MSAGRRALLTTLLMLGACATTSDDLAAQVAAPIAVEATALPLDGDDPTLTRVGGLDYRGGLVLTSSDRRFGGWSDLWIDEQRGRVTLLSDAGWWSDLALVEHEGQLVGVADARFGALTDIAGQRVRAGNRDAEAMARMPDGGFIVAFEQRHRLWEYGPSEPPFSRPPRALATPSGLDQAPPNGGIEALARLADGQLVALAEDLTDTQGRVGWVGDGRSWGMLSYASEPDFKPTGAVGLPGGETLVLERRFSFLRGFASRIVLVARDAWRPGAVVRGAEIARFEPPLAFDNLEGIAIARGREGETLIYVVSDNNYNFLQRTVLVKFAIVTP
jgi:hypothetical protein